MRVLDLFSGIGGFSLGLERTGGFKTVQFCEIDPFCRRVLAKHWPDVPCHDDVTTMQFHEGMADVVTGGFPCQDISFAGLGAGLAGSRSGLYRHLVGAIGVVRPRYAILENVAALLSRGLGDVLGDLAQIGYDAECHCIPASAVGAPHRRDRVWIVAHARGQQHEGHSLALSGALATQLSASDADHDVHEGRLAAREGAGTSGASEGGDTGEGQASYGEWLRVESGPGCKAMADAFRERELQPQGSKRDKRRRTSNGGADLANPAGIRRNAVVEPIFGGASGEGAANTTEYTGFTGWWGWWAIEPDVGRVANGIPQRVDRLRSLGNSIVPQIATLIGQAILTAEQQQAEAA